MQTDEWKALILECSKLVSERVELCVFEGASESAIREAESRLGTNLPPSYREFLKASNGLQQAVEGFIPCSGGDFWLVENVDWFRVRNSDWIKIWEEDDFEVSDEKYFDYGPEQNTCNMRPQYLQDALEISHDGDSGIYLLIPDIKGENGEWEAWHFANWLPGAYRFRSFEELMIRKRDELIKRNPDDRDGWF